MRVKALEREVAARDRVPGGIANIIERLVPTEVRQHLRASQREQLLAMRAYVDRVISRIEEEDEARERRRPRKVTVE